MSHHSPEHPLPISLHRRTREDSIRRPGCFRSSARSFHTDQLAAQTGPADRRVQRPGRGYALSRIEQAPSHATTVAEATRPPAVFPAFLPVSGFLRRLRKAAHHHRHNSFFCPFLVLFFFIPQFRVDKSVPSLHPARLLHELQATGIILCFLSRSFKAGITPNRIDSADISV